MKFSYKDILRFLNTQPSKDDLSDKLFQLGHEHIVDGDIFDMEFTPNRGDCLSLIGLSRDLNVFYGKRDPLEYFEKEIDELNLDFENASEYDCPSISLLSIKIQGPISDYKDYMSSYFGELGNNKINFFTDISNYISYELGQPTHSFDKEKIDGKLIFARSSSNVKFKTLLGDKLDLEGDNCVFIVNDEVVSLAGIMGGASTACDTSTKNALIECAYFRPESIIGKSIKYNLQSDAAHKFERGVDPTCHEKVLRRFIKIIEDHVDIKEINILKCESAQCKSVFIEKDVKKINNILGTSIKEVEYKEILEKLGFNVSSRLEVPSYRSDIANQNDIAEEIARVIGYNNIQNSKINIQNFNRPKNKKLHHQLRSFFIENGFSEVINFPFVKSNQGQCISVDNPIDSNRKYLRTNLQSSLLENLLYNERRQKDSIKLFEISDVYSLKDTSYTTKIGVIACGRQGHDYINFSKKIDENYLSTLIKDLFDNKSLKFQLIKRDNLNTKRKEKIFYLEFELRDLKRNILHPEENEKSFASLKFHKYKKISELPSSARDFSFLVEDLKYFNEFLECLNNIENEYLKDSFIFDFYKNQDSKQVKIGFRIIFQSEDFTLSDADIQANVSKILDPIISIPGVSVPGLKL